MKITSLKTNHLVLPMGARHEPLTLTWITESGRKDYQAAARVELAWDADFRVLTHDSGWREDISSLGYRPPVALAARTRYYWRVFVRSVLGEEAESETAWFETGKMDEPWEARWIKAPYGEAVHPVIFREFQVDGEVASARLYATGLGLYEGSLNGEPIGDEVLMPFYNEYDHWQQAQAFDVTGLIQKGLNRLSFMLGEGWYMGRFGFLKDMRNLYGSELKVLAELRVRFAGGGEMVLGSDESWWCRRSPVVDSSIYNGETYDARLEDTAGAPDRAVFASPAKGRLMDRLSPPLRVCRFVAPRELIHTPAGETVIDFGQVLTGWVFFSVNLPGGAAVTLDHGELLQNGNFYNDNLRSAKQRFTYISKGQPAEVRPHFTYFGFRYVRVTGLDEVNLAHFRAGVIHSDLPVTGSLTTSNPKVNRLFQNAFWGQIGNFLDVPTDCPQRDERMGWTGDAHVFAPTASFNMYTPAFYHKYLYDMVLSQRLLEGAVPHVVPDAINQISRVLGEELTHFGSCAWGDAAAGIPWTLYQFYGDKALLAQHYENMKRWADWIIGQDEHKCGARRLWLCGFHYADWLALDNPVRKSTFGGTDPYFVASSYYYYSILLTARAAQALGQKEDQRRYLALAEEIKAAFHQEFFTPTGRIAVPTQTALVLALAFDLVPEVHRERAKKDLRERIKARNWHLDTGFVGTYLICRVLSENGMSDIAYTLLLNEDFPGWLYQVNLGATTIWERWDSVLPDGTVSDTGMNSMNHYAYGAMVEWMYRFMCGLQPLLESPGMKRVDIAPHSDPRLDYAGCEYISASGKYAAGWKRTAGGVEYTVEIPFDCQAVFVPEERFPVVLLDGVPCRVKEQGILLEPGIYTITAMEHPEQPSA